MLIIWLFALATNNQIMTFVVNAKLCALQGMKFEAFDFFKKSDFKTMLY